ncbi:non-ribosomal peptide synthase/polyketide synthase [Chitinophaga nivalis]|uniref:Non-ribosomal peptide synthase/polyketide synthase n=1 Tax=Chitinophaga nivalis TaxID=2991709 RepID=A0ABT3IGX0_9BACT|nr:non-ribosomal peptide synthase/polyketide synthase [Chitinophaga nivalis]MCW3467113.1 non-ribosomal peptide synthase/polyketide synthase [Chitinophaga nivalis]MCW3483196.1 non-ribosomal peptide synthase/polyketide synthase [Chitinophaga nivalis]
MSDFNLSEIKALLQKADENGIKIFLDDDQLIVEMHEDTEIDDVFLDELRNNKAYLITYFQDNKSQDNAQTHRITAVPRDGDTLLPLSFSQERLWFIDQLEGSVHYHIPAVLRLKGTLNKAALQQALQYIINRHEVLRTVIRLSEQSKKAYQHLLELDSWQLDNVEITDTLEETVAAYIRTPFDLQADHMLKAGLIKLTEQEHVLAINVHHIAADGWSLSVIVNELMALYAGFSAGEAPALPPMDIQYADFAVWQREYLSGEILAGQQAYWQQQLADLEPLNLPGDYPRPAVQSTNGAAISRVLDRTLTGALNKLSQQEGATLHMTLLAAFEVLLYRYSGQEDICVGTPLAGRRRRELEDLIGFFINMLAVRNQLGNNPTFIGLLAQVKETLLAAYDHQDIPFEKVVETVMKTRDRSRSPLFQVMFTLQNTPATPDLTLGDLTLSVENTAHTIAKSDLSFMLGEADGELVLNVEYCTDLFKEATIIQMMGHYEQLLKAIVAQPSQQIDFLNMLQEGEANALLQLAAGVTTAYPDNKTITTLFAEQALIRPDAVAVVFEDAQLTYRQLDELSNQLAHYLLAEGVTTGMMIPVCIDRSVDMMVGIQAILKAGAVYVPLDPAHPPARLRFILDDTSSSVVLTTLDYWQDLFEAVSFAGKCICIDIMADVIALESPVQPVVALTADDQAYVMYTSGSTGNPKGVLVNHRNVVSLVKDTAYFPFNENSIVLSTGSTSFDAVTFDYWGTLLNGGQLVLSPEKKLLDSSLLKQLLIDKQVNGFFITSGWFNQLVNTDVEIFAGLNYVLTGGEKVSVEHVMKLRHAYPALNIVHVYGPTENTTFSLYYPVTEFAYPGTIPIGRPLYNRGAYILDKHQQLVPIGVPGEILVSGSGLAAGYLHLPEMTAEKFIVDPFNPAARVYRTGDLARWLPDGNIEFVGRADDQVKIRGFRIELGEIENILQQHPQVKQCVVIAKVGNSGSKYLIGYVVPEEEFDKAAVQAWLKDRLPDYMVPAQWVTMNELPLTVNGKVNRKTLPDPESEESATVAYVAPRNPVESTLVNIWQDILGVERVGIYDNFFELGGHSLLIIRLQVAIREQLQAAVEIKDLFVYMTIAELAAYVTPLQSAGGILPAITVQERPTHIPLSFGQERLWFIDQLEGSTHYHSPAILNLTGAVSREGLAYALKYIVERHEVLRTVIRQTTDDGNPYQEVIAADSWQMDTIHTGTELREDITAYINTPFDLANDYMLRASLISLSEEAHMLIVVVHHIASDGWSTAIVIKELKELYSAYIHARTPVLAPLPVQYADYAIWERTHLDDALLAKQETYWKQRLAGVQVLNLSTDYVRPLYESRNGTVLVFSLDKELTGALNQFSLQQGATLYMTLLSAFKVLMYRYSAQEDICVGTPVAGRKQAEVEGLVGFFVNTLAVRSDLSGTPSFQQLLQQVKANLLEGYAHQDMPFEKVVETVVKTRDLSRSPIFQVMFELQQSPDKSQDENDDFAFSLEETQHTTTLFDLTFTLSENGNGLFLSVEYCTDIFAATTIERMARHYEQLLRTVVADPQQQIDVLSILAPDEAAALLQQFSGPVVPYPTGKTFVQLFEEQAQLTPDAIALAFNETTLTYGALLAKANQLAHHLIQAGVKADTLVPICIERSLEMIIGVVGIMKAGGAYVPIDPKFPAERIGYILEDSNATILVSSETSREVIPAGTAIISMDGDQEILAQYPITNPVITTTPQQLAYVIYTSGSTGKPKGVLVEHAGLLNHLLAMITEFEMNAATSLAFTAPYTFDISVWQMINTLLCGGCTVIYPESLILRPDAMIRDVEARGITLLQLVPSYLTAVLQDDGGVQLSALQYLLVTGEAVSRQLLEQWFAHPAFGRIPVVNAYGPTEASDDVSFYFMREAPVSANVPVGKAVQNLHLYVLDAGHGLCPYGVPGEIAVGGIGVARGYLNRDALTAEKFIADPYHGGRMYKTGDVGRWLPDGNIEYLGRIDDQVKIRGYRIELGEIENAMHLHETVTGAVVVAKADESGIKRLVGYLVVTPEYKREVLQAWLQEQLPEYMIPVLVELPAFPLTANGKVDKKALPDPVGDAIQQRTYVAPRNETETQLAAIWQQLLGVERVGIYDNFFELGGHSLLAIRLLSQLRKALSVELTVKEVFLYPTVATLAARVSGDTGQTSLPPVTAVQPRPERIPLSYSQERLWFIDRLEGSTHYHIPAVLKLNGAVDVAGLSYALQQIVVRHEVLRTVIIEEDGTGYQQVLPADNWTLSIQDAGTQPEVLIAALAETPFDLARDYMLRAGLLRVSATEHILVINMHHIASDGWSSSIVVSELTALYSAYMDGREAVLPELPVQYADFAIWQRNYLSGDVLAQQQAYWKQQLSGVATLDLPTDFTRPAIQGRNGAAASFHLNLELTEQLNRLSQQQGVTLFMTLMTAFQVLLHRYSSQDDICIGTPIAGRSQQEIEGLIGFFINTLAIRNDLGGDPVFTALLQQVKETLLAAYQHQDTPFEKVVDTVVKTRDMSRSPLVQVMFVLQNLPEEAGDAGFSLNILEEEAAHTNAKFDLTFLLEETINGLALSVEYCTDLFRPDTIERMARHYEQLLQAIVAAPVQKLSELRMLSAAEETQLLNVFKGETAGYPKDKTIVDLLEAQALRTPDAVAVVYASEKLTYQELDARANQLGHYLRSKGVQPETLVPVCAERSLDMIVAMLGVLKAGGAYVPMDPLYPEDRIHYMLEDTAAQVVVCQRSNEHLFTHIANRVVIDGEAAAISAQPVTTVPVVRLPQHVAYVIYTSGSTGRPKGVLIEHENVVRLFETDKPLYDFNSSDVWTMFHSFCFDFSVWEMYGALFYGGRLVVVPKAVTQDTGLFGELLISEGVTVLNQTPSSFYVVQDYLTARTNTTTIRYVIFGGEALNPAKLKPWQELYPASRLINMYGITETTVHVTYQELTAAHVNSSASVIGKPIPTLTAYILDSHQSLVPVGVAGELYIGGAGVARGYLNRDELTATRFIASPFAAGERLYRTGDLARWYADGNLEYLGRIDDQVKIRGFRIELGEIEHVLQQSGLVSNGVVLAKADHTGTKQLVGYVVPKEGFSRDAVQAHLKIHLPEYMVPALWVILEEIPLTTNGKVNRKALPEPDADLLTDNEYVAPRTETEHQLVNIWQELLGIQRVGIHDNFFALGGDSIRVIKVVSKIASVLEKQVKVFEVYQAATIAQLGALLDEKTKADDTARLYEAVKAELEELRNKVLPQLADAALVEDVYPMSDIERGMIYVSLVNPADALYHDQFVYEMTAAFTPEILQEAYRLLAAKHSILRTAFHIGKDEQDLQVVYSKVDIHIDWFDLQDASGNLVKQTVEEYLAEERKTPFVVDKAPLWKASVFRLKEHNLLVFQFHHAILDGWSVASLNTELFTLCDMLLEQQAAIPVVPLKCSYKDYIIESLVAKRNDANLVFWKNELADYKRLDIFSRETAAEAMTYRYAPAFYQQLKEKAQRDKISMKGLFLGAYLFALNLLTHEEEVTVGLVTNNRPVLEDGDRLLGCFLNTIPLRMQLERQSTTWKTYFAQIEDKLVQLKERDRTSLFEITKITGEQTAEENPFFDAIFNFVNFHVYEKLGEDATAAGQLESQEEVKIRDHELTNTFLDCTVSITGNQLQVEYSLRKKLKSGKHIQDLLDYSNLVLEAFLHQDEALMHTSFRLPEAELAQLLPMFAGTVVSYPKDKTMVAIFAEQVAARPDAIALVYEDTRLSYQELDEQTTRLAHYLHQQGVTTGMLIPVCMDKHIDMMVCILGVLKAGAAYVPVDPAYPLERIRFIRENVGSSLILTTSDYQQTIFAAADITGNIICIDQLHELEKLDITAWTAPVLSPEDAAIIVYTSGSTGTPKGVILTHRNVVSLVKEADYYPFAPTQVLLSTGAISFDAVTFEYWSMLLNGGRLILSPEKTLLDSGLLKQLLQEQAVNTLFLTTAWFNQLINTDITVFERLTYVFTGGEKVSAEHMVRLRAAYPALHLLHMYGPAENTTYALYYPVTGTDYPVTVPIGRPLSNRGAYVVDKHLQHVPIGVPGEILVSGDGLAKGYLHLPEMTAEKFIENPFQPGQRVYRTGDIGRWLPDGNIEFVGRADNQVKIRGYRIELGEIENVLQQSEGVVQCVVLAKADATGGKRLVAYIVAAPGFDKEGIQTWLKAQLPDYMVPVLWVTLDEMPLTVNGKVNHKALPDPDAGDLIGRSYTAPRNTIENTLVNIWQELLGIQRIGIYDNFFELGGHSLLAIRLMGAIRKALSAELIVKDLFVHTNIASLAAYVQQQQGSGTLLPVISKQERPARIPLSFGQERLWFIDQLEGSVHYHIPVVLKLEGDVNRDALQYALQYIVERHESLRTVIRQSAEEETGFQEILPAGNWKMLIAEGGAQPQQRMAAFIQQPFDLSADYMMRAALFSLSGDVQALVITMHHIASDGWSMSVVIRELTALYSAYVTQQPVELEPLPLQYADYAIWERAYLQGDVLARQIAYWRKKLSGVEPLNLPTDYVRPVQESRNGAVLQFPLPLPLAASLNQLSLQQGATLYMTLLAAFKVLLFRYSAQEDICVGTPVAGRGQQEVEGLVGFFINTLAVRSDLSGAPAFVELLQQLKTTLLEGYEHQEMPFEKVVEAVVKTRDLSRSPIFQVMFELQQAPEVSRAAWSEAAFLVEEPEQTTALFDLTFTLSEGPHDLSLNIEYCTDLFAAATINRMAGHYEQLLQAIVANPQQQINQLSILAQEEATTLLQQFSGPVVPYPADKTFVQLFEEQAQLTPDAIALAFNETTLTYGALLAKANQLAHHLIQAGVKTDTLVPICIERSLEMIIGVVGIIKAGGAYVPIDPKFPAERIGYILEDSNATILVSSEASRGVIPAGTAIISMDGDQEILAQYPITNPVITTTPQQLAYVIYTSGSTGKPKGVLVEHAGLLNHLLAMITEFEMNAATSLAFTAPYTFDISVWQMINTLLCGGCTVIYPESLILRPDAMIRDVEARGITLLQLVPSYLTAVLQDDGGVQLSALQYLLVTGEAVSRQLLEQWFAHPAFGRIPVVNAYGPTEASDDVSFYFMREAPVSANVPVGKAVQNLHLYVLDAGHGLCPYGVPGEIAVGGIGVARGYLNRDALTAEKFIADPYHGGRMYKTGDVGRWLPDGNIEYLGRIDDQVKIRGYRIELGEIENAMHLHETVTGAVVVAKADESGIKRLVGYLVVTPEYKREVLQAWLQEQLPEYMIPVLVELPAFPLTANGKVDKKALPDPVGDAIQQRTYVAPRNETETQLAAIWQQLLGVERVGIYDNFFELGGHSLLAIRLLSQLRKALSVELTVKEVFLYPTVATLAARVSGDTGQTSLPPVTVVQPRPERIPLSYSQERLWFIDRLEGSTHYHIPAILKLEGTVNTVALEAALREIVVRHEVLRSVIIEEEGIGYQQVLPAENWTLTIQDAGDQLESLIAALAETPFDLARDYMLRAGLLRVAATEYILVINTHHIASDGWSSGIIIGELTALYSAYIGNREADLPALQVQYADFAIWQRNYLSGEVLAQQQAYWKQQLSGVATLDLPTDFTRPATQSTRGAMMNFQLPVSLNTQLNELSRQEGVTLYMTLLAAFQVLLHRYSGQEDICVGTPVAGRSQQEIEALIGFFVNTIAVRNDLGGNPAFTALLQQVKDTLLAGYQHQDTPFEKVADLVTKNRDLSRTPVFQVLFVLQNTPDIEEGGAFSLDGLTLSEKETPHTTAKFDLSFVIEEQADGLALSVEYCTDLFREESIVRMAAHYEQLLQAIAATPAQSLSELPMLSAAEETQLLTVFKGETAGYPKDKTIVDLLEAQALRTPDAVAVVYASEKLTYGELDARANQLGHYLRSKGVQPETLVPVCAERSLDMIVAMLGVLKAGGAYVPMDPLYPEDRIHYMLEDTAAQVVVCQRSNEHLFAHIANRVVIDGETAAISAQPVTTVPVVRLPQHVAYVIYTSGSTGRPKGVLIENENVVRLFETDKPLYDFNSSDVWTMFHSFCFDFSVWEMYGALFYGGRLVVVPKEVTQDTGLFGELLISEGVTVLNQTPSSFYVVQDYLTARTNTTTIRYVIFGGEALNPAKLKPWQELYPASRLINMYGITETTVHVTYQELTAAHVNSSASVIGKPIPTLTAYILDSHQSLVPVGVAGELYIGGAGVARGYLNRDELTATRFIASPFAAGERLYRTGDLARWYADGNLEYLGRIDDQVKIRGFRIELGEIEHVLQQSGLVSNGVVLAKTDHTGTKQLVGYVVPKEGFSRDAVQAHLKIHLPEYMVPALWVILEEIPLTTNGKVNRKALPEPETSILKDNAYEAPRTATEYQLVSIWQELLGIQRIGIHDSFFELGGHSLLVIRLIAAVRKALAVELTVKDVFVQLNIAALGAFIDRQGNKVILPPITAITDRPAQLPLSFSQERLWFIDQLEGSVHYHMPVVLRLKGTINTAALEYAIRGVIARHEVLRTVIREQEGQGYQHILTADNWQLALTDKGDDVQETIAGFIQQPFDLSADYMLRAGVIALAEKEHLLMIVMHHIASDGWSMAIIVEELTALYTAYEHQQQPDLPPLPIQYADYALWQRSYITGEVLTQQQHYWRRQLADLEPLDLPLDYPRPAVQSTEGQVLRFDMDRLLVDKINHFSQQQGATLFMTLLAACKVLLHHYSRQTDICIGTPLAGRTQQEAEALVGYFINTLAVRSNLEGNPAFTSLLQQVKETMLEGYAHQDMPFEKVVEAVVKDRDMSRTPLFQVMFSLQNMPAATGLALGELELSVDEPAAVSAKFELNFTVTENNGDLELSIEYRTDLFAAATIERMAAHYEQLLWSIVCQPSQEIGVLPLLTAEEGYEKLHVFNTISPNQHKQEAATIVDLFTAQVAKQGAATAVAYEGTVLTYKELEKKSDQLAHYLRKKGVKAESLVPVCMERSTEMLVAILGILKAGAAYVPIDPSFPSDRKAFILADTACRVVLADTAIREQIQQPDDSLTWIDIKAEWPTIGKQKSVPAKINYSSADGLVYVIYTSGSTGQPKGVMIEHHSLVDYVNGLCERIDIAACRTFALIPTIATDLGNTVIYGSLATGGALHIISEESINDAALLQDYFNAHPIDCLKIVPSHWKALCTDTALLLPKQLLIFGGEALQQDVITAVSAAGTACRIVNHYGPTETTIGKCMHIVDVNRTYHGVPVGTTFSRTTAYILNPYGGLVPVGVSGELCIGGNGVARGYLNQPELTAEKFVPHPFSTAAGSRLYRTGDLARWLPDGSIVYMGRIDDQVKIRGYRVELGEIERVLQQSGLVTQGVVLAQTESSGNKRLVGYVVTAGEFDKTVIQEYLRSRLPEYMVPAIWVPLAEMPLTANGKINRKRLPALTQAEEWLSHTYTAPRNAIETSLAAVWQELLDVQRVGIYDNFFELGGHSLAAVRLLARIRKLGYSIRLSELMLFKTVAEQAALLADQSEDATTNRNEHIVLLRNAPGNQAVFIVPGGAGITDGYEELANQLDAAGPVYGLNMMGVLEGETPLETIAGIAAQNIHWMKEVQPVGPYQLVGHSFGGKVVHEMIRQLEAQAEQVHFAAILDTVADAGNIPVTAAGMLGDMADYLEEYGLLQQPYPEWMATLQAAMEQLPEADMRAYMTAVITEKCFTEFGAQDLQVRLFRLLAANSTMRYAATGKITTPVTVIRAAEQDWAALGFDDTLGWTDYIQTIHTHTAPGSHDNMIRKENAAALAAYLNKQLLQG